MKIKNKIISFFFVLLLSLGLTQPAFSTISTVQNQVVVGGNGVTNTFSFNFVGDQASDFQLIFTNANGQQTTIPPSQYLVALNASQPGSIWGVGGTVTYPLMGAPIPNGSTLTIQRLLPLQQLVSISGQGDFNPQSVEQAIDIIEMQTQQVSARTGQLRGTWASSVVYNYGDMVVDGAAGNNTGNIYLCANSNTSNVWTTDVAVGDWSLALNVQAIVNSLPQIPNNTVFANISGSTATPVGITTSALLDSTLGNVQGDILYRGGSLWSVLPPGTTGQVLTTHGASANPTWSSSSGSGTVTSVGSGTGLSGGPITGIGTLSLATIANNSLLANTSGGTAAPSPTTLSALLDSVLGSTQGSIIYRAGSVWSALGPGTLGQLLQTGGAAANPSWAGVSSTTGAEGQFQIAGTPFIVKYKTNLTAGSNWQVGATWTFSTPFPTALVFATFIPLSIPNNPSLPWLGTNSVSSVVLHSTNSSDTYTAYAIAIGY